MSRLEKIRVFALVGALTGLATVLGVSTAAIAAIPDAPRLKPPAPGPSYIEESDLSKLAAVKDAVGRRDYAKAKSIGGSIADPTARSLADWYYFDAEDPLVSIEATDRFLDAHPDWPSLSKIQSHAEERMPWTLSPATVLDFFQSRDPRTGEGKVQLARAQFATGAPDAALAHLRDAWINNTFKLPDEQRLLANYGARLTADDYAARADRLLWAREVTTAKRTFSRLQPSERRKAEARAAMLLGGNDGLRLYNHLNEEERADSGVMLAAVRYFRRKEEEPRAIAIVRAAPTDPAILRDPGRWWYEQNLLMRWALKNRQYADAYAMASHHGLEAGSGDFAEAEFSAGWIALRFLNEPDRAEKHFAALTANVGAPISLARGWYWLARAADARGETAVATARYGKAAEHIYTFYGQLAAEKIGGDALLRAFEPSPPATPEEKARFAARPAVAALRMLTDLKDERGFLIFAYHIDDALESRGEFRELADLAIGMKAPHVAVRAGKVAVRSGAFAPDVAYPDIAVPNAASRFAPSEVILGLSRQESEFNPRAYSRAGARGMMQLIPSTAQATARKAGLQYNRAALLNDPQYNMTIGSAHLSHLFDRFGGSWIMTFAAYNAGANRVTQWVEAYGDPRNAATDPLDWIEQIPFEETRNYVQRVLENSQIYRSRLTKGAIAGALAFDIERGGPANRIAATPSVSAPGVLPDVQARIAKMADPILNPVIATSESVSHSLAPPAPEPKVKPRTGAVKSGAKKSSPRINRRQSFRLKSPPPIPSDTAHTNPAPDAAPKPAASETAIAASPVSAEQAGMETLSAEAAEAPKAVNAAPLMMAPVDSAMRKALDAEAAYAEEALLPETSEDADAVPASADAPSEAEAVAAPDECIAYSDYIAETAKEEASADDLNAGAFAEFIGGGSACQ
ncbi:MAG: lytic transglycosylase domain-containing protein [Parvularculaceae bacterium]|nr:lytic transglycosylase domain-containing protein [Parvularculaceae bacterium]